MERQVPHIVVTATKVRPGVANDDFPEITILGVELSCEKDSWLESWATEAELRAFLKGVQAGSAMTGGPHVQVFVDIPRVD